jgi:hypothetical protein
MRPEENCYLTIIGNPQRWAIKARAISNSLFYGLVFVALVFLIPPSTSTSSKSTAGFFVFARKI